MRRALLVALTLLAALLVGYLTTRYDGRLVAGLVVLAFAAVLLVLALPRYGRVDGWLWRWAYGRYLRSGGWRRTARQVLRRDRFTCWRCGQEYPAVSWRQSGLEYIMLEGTPLQAHHLRYQRWYWYAAAPLLGLRENIDDLVTVCRGCHAELHGKSKEER